MRIESATNLLFHFRLGPLPSWHWKQCPAWFFHLEVSCHIDPGFCLQVRVMSMVLYEVLIHWAWFQEHRLWIKLTLVNLLYHGTQNTSSLNTFSVACFGLKWRLVDPRHRVIVRNILVYHQGEAKRNINWYIYSPAGKARVIYDSQPVIWAAALNVWMC